MAPHTVKWFTLLGFAFLFAGLFAARFLILRFRAGDIRGAWRVAEVCAGMAGITLGCTLFGFTIYASPTVKTVGFPFLAAVFELHGPNWVDYVGIFTLPAAVGNFLVGILAPHLILASALWTYLKRHR